MVKEYFSQLAHHWKVLLRDRAYFVSLALGVVVIFAALIVSMLVSAYKDATFYEPVGDLLLEQLPTMNLEFLFTWGFYAIIGLICAYPLFRKPELAPFTLKTFGILLLVRSAFIMLTNIGPPEGFFYADQILKGGAIESTRIFRFANDLFFSGHTATPFLAFLLFRKSKFKWVMLAGSLLMGATVLLMKVHYSIDVFAAFFITYGVYALSDKIFNNLNLRFNRKIKIHGWKALQLKLRGMRERRALKKVNKLEKKGVLTTN
jgi:membrane-associated phospholipid phosphatase